MINKHVLFTVSFIEFKKKNTSKVTRGYFTILYNRMLLFKRVCFEKGKKKLKVNIKDYKESYLGPCQTTKMEHRKHIRKKEAAWENFEKGFVFDIVKVSF